MPEANLPRLNTVDPTTQQRLIVKANWQARIMLAVGFIAVALIGIGLVPFGFWLFSQPPSSVSESDISSTLSPRIIQDIKPVSPPAPTPTSQLRSRDATLQAIDALTSTMMVQSQLVYGPAAGKLVHRTDNYVSVQYADVAVGNFVAEATFDNPYVPEEGTWDFGFMFRSPGDSNNNYRLVIKSNEKWAVELVRQLSDREKTTFTTVENGWLPESSLDVSANGSNHLRLVVADNQAYIYLNHEFISSVDVGGLLVGDVAVATGLWNGDAIKGKSTRYTGFAIWSSSPLSAKPRH